MKLRDNCNNHKIHRVEDRTMSSQNSLDGSDQSADPLLDNNFEDEPGESSINTNNNNEQQTNTTPQHMQITRSTKLYAFCASLNSCNLGYDIGVNTGAGLLLQRSLNLSNAQ